MKIYRASDLFLGAKTIGSLFLFFPFHRGEIGKTALRDQKLGVLWAWDYFLPTSKFSGLGSFGQFCLGGSGVISEAAWQNQGDPQKETERGQAEMSH